MQAQGSVLATSSMLAAVLGVGRAPTKEAGAKALLQLCQGLHSPRREHLPFIREAAGAVLGLLLRLLGSLCCSRCWISLA